jgi:hypothetical protein
MMFWLEVLWKAEVPWWLLAAYTLFYYLLNRTPARVEGEYDEIHRYLAKRAGDLYRIAQEVFGTRDR